MPSNSLPPICRYLYGHGVPANCDKAALFYEVAANAAVDEMERLKVREGKGSGPIFGGRMGGDLSRLGVWGLGLGLV